MARYTDDLLDEKFAGVHRELEPVKSLPAALGALTSRIDAQSAAINEVREDTRTVMRVLLGFFSALLLALIAAIVGVVIAL